MLSGCPKPTRVLLLLAAPGSPKLGMAVVGAGCCVGVPKSPVDAEVVLAPNNPPPVEVPVFPNVDPRNRIKKRYNPNTLLRNND